MKLQHLAYISTSTSTVGPRADIADIVAQSVRHNPANNITGALTFIANRFVQLLEGSHGSLDVLVLKLMLDPRHRDLIFIDRAAIPTRSFGDWSMASLDPSPAADLRLAALVDDGGPIAGFQRLLLDMVTPQHDA